MVNTSRMGWLWGSCRLLGPVAVLLLSLVWLRAGQEVEVEVLPCLEVREGDSCVQARKTGSMILLVP